MFRRLAALGIAICLACVILVAALAGEKAGQRHFISKVGTYRLFRGKLTVRFFEDDEKGKLNYCYVRPISDRVSLFRRFEQTVSTGPSEPWIEKGSNWFAFAESHPTKEPKGLWIYDGRDLLVQVAFGPREKTADPGGGFFAEYPGYEYHSDSKPSILKDAPKAVRDRLPESFKNDLEGKSQ